MDIHDVVGYLFRLFFDPRPVDVGVAVGKVALGLFSLSTLGFPYQHHFASAVYSYLIYLPLTLYDLSSRHRR